MQSIRATSPINTAKPDSKSRIHYPFVVHIQHMHRSTYPPQTHQLTGLLMQICDKNACLPISFTVVILELRPNPVQKALKPASVMLSGPEFVCQQLTRSAPTQCIPPNLMLRFCVNIHSSSYIYRSTPYPQIHGFKSDATARSQHPFTNTIVHTHNNSTQ